jgi:hypothetical protein
VALPAAVVQGVFLHKGRSRRRHTRFGAPRRAQREGKNRISSTHSIIIPALSRHSVQSFSFPSPRSLSFRADGIPNTGGNCREKAQRAQKLCLDSKYRGQKRGDCGFSRGGAECAEKAETANHVAGVLIPLPNSNGIESISPGLRGNELPRVNIHRSHNPERGCIGVPKGKKGLARTWIAKIDFGVEPFRPAEFPPSAS